MKLKLIKSLILSCVLAGCYQPLERDEFEIIKEAPNIERYDGPLGIIEINDGVCFDLNKVPDPWFVEYLREPSELYPGGTFIITAPIEHVRLLHQKVASRFAGARQFYYFRVGVTRHTENPSSRAFWRPIFSGTAHMRDLIARGVIAPATGGALVFGNIRLVRHGYDFKNDYLDFNLRAGCQDLFVNFDTLEIVDLGNPFGTCDRLDENEAYAMNFEYPSYAFLQIPELLDRYWNFIHEFRTDCPRDASTGTLDTEPE